MNFSKPALLQNIKKSFIFSVFPKEVFLAFSVNVSEMPTRVFEDFQRESFSAEKRNRLCGLTQNIAQ